MKVGVLTFHNAYNYGAVLQAYATQELVKSLGHEAEVIDYHNKKVDWAYERRKFHLRGFLRNSYRCPLYILEKCFFWQRRIAYSKFFRHYMNISDKKHFEGDTCSLNGYDVILIGSDQLWNKKLTGGLDKVYWGQFNASSNSKIVAWSVCMNDVNINEEEMSCIEGYLRSFSAISVREEPLQQFLSSLTDKKVWHTLDPTLMLPKYKWEELCRPVKECNYIAVYAVRKENETIAFARKIAQKLNKRLVIIRSYAKWYLSRENKECLGPDGFLSYIKNADFVVTSSFHGTVFSILFQRQFVCPKFDGNVRIEDLLRTVGLSNRMIDDWHDAFNLPSIDYNGLSGDFKVKWNDTLNFLKGI